MKGIIYFLIFFSGFMAACGDNEEPDLSYFLSNTWKMTEATENGIDAGIDLTNYRLTLNEDLTYTRTGLNGEDDSGTWSVVNSGNQLIINSDLYGQEEYIIVELQIRMVELQVLQESRKSGTTEYRFILEPIRP